LPALHAQLTDSTGPPDAVVVNLGTNDVLQSLGEAWRPSFDSMISWLVPVPCVVLTTISGWPEVIYEKPPLAATINAAIAAAVTAHPNMHVVDWGQELLGPNASAYNSDGIHPSWSTDLTDSTRGAYRIAELDLASVRGSCGLPDASVPSTTTTTTEPEPTTIAAAG
jgi:hypothetical protein